MSVLKSAEKYQGSDDEVFRARAISIKEERAELVKHHLMVLWVDFFTAEHRKEFPDLDDLFWRAILQAGNAKKSVDPVDGQKLVDLIDEIAEVFWKTEKAKTAGVYPPS
jgi:nickel superoxide dismutase